VARRLDPPTEAEAPAHEEPLVDVGTAEALPILLVDDRSENLRTLEAVLSPLGYPLATATSGSEALRLLLENEYALILLDVRMPGLDGLETAQLIKGRARTRDVPIVFLTAARDEVADIIRGYGVGAVDYVLKPFDPELLRSKVAVFAELEASRRALKHSEAFLRGAFEAAPIGKTVLSGDCTIVRSNPAFAHMVGRAPAELQGIAVAELCVEEDREPLSDLLDTVAHGEAPRGEGVDLRLRSSSGPEVWVALVASSIEPRDLGEPLLLVQWVDLTVRRRAERARAELMLEQAARGQAEAIAERLSKLQALTSALQSMSLDELLLELASRLAEIFDVEIAEVEISNEFDEPILVRATRGDVAAIELVELEPLADGVRWQEAPLTIEGTMVGVIRLALSADRAFNEAERSLLRDAAERAALSIRRTRTHEEEHRIAVELQRGLIPKRLPRVAGIELAAHYDVAGIGAEVGGDWYDAFALRDGRLGVVLGDVAGRGIRAASTMGQLRSVARAYALADGGERQPGEVLTLVNRYQLALDESELVTAVYAVFDPRAQAMAWTSAGHPPPLLRTAAGESRYLDGGNPLMGVEDTRYETLRQRIGPGDALIFYTDGLVERRGESLDVGLDRLKRAAGAGPADDPRALCAHVVRELVSPDSQLHDDVTAVVVRLR
jgi:PAS domain S-box-containing protein